jgi:hypothetical protein
MPTAVAPAAAAPRNPRLDSAPMRATSGRLGPILDDHELKQVLNPVQ